MDWVYRGRCWRFGDNIGIDGDLMPLEFALTRETDPEVLKHHTMSGIDPEFAKSAKPHDLVVAGKRFAQGNPHIQGLLGLAGLELGLVVESIPRGSFRNAINAGVPILPHCPGVTGEAATGDELEVDFAGGLFRNLSRGTEQRYEPLDPVLLETIAAGGWKAKVLQRIAEIKRVGPGAA